MSVASKELIQADMFRSIESVIKEWESNITLDVDDMALHLEEMCKVWEGKQSYVSFLGKTGLRPIKYN